MPIIKLLRWFNHHFRKLYQSSCKGGKSWLPETSPCTVCDQGPVFCDISCEIAPSSIHFGIQNCCCLHIFCSTNNIYFSKKSCSYLLVISYLEFENIFPAQVCLFLIPLWCNMYLGTRILDTIFHLLIIFEFNWQNS